MLKRTPLYEKHIEMKGKIVDFNGWELPIQYIGIIEEHTQVRKGAGLFDVSHMGEIIVKGAKAEEFIQKIISNDISKMIDHQIQYSPMCYHNGGIVDDLLVYKINREEFLLVVNASNIDKDFEWMKEQLEFDLTINNVSNEYAQLALQGPKAESILQKLVTISLKEIPFFHFEPHVMINDIDVLLSRTGYTGEDGFELYVSPTNACELWDMLLAAGKEEDLMPIGLGARDTLRFEAALPLYGQELSLEISPLEAGLDRFVKLVKNDFIGKESLVKQKQQGLSRKLIGFEMLDRGIPRPHFLISEGDSAIGFVTSGSYSPSLHKNIGLAMVDSRYTDIGSTFDVMIRNKAIKAKVVSLPFYDKRYKRSKESML